MPGDQARDAYRIGAEVVERLDMLAATCPVLGRCRGYPVEWGP
jgi:hypothetical protein